MDYITINEAFTAVVPIPESTNIDTVTYTVYKSDGTVFASGNATFIAGINWKVSFTPNIEDVFIVEVNDSTLDVKYSQSFKCVRSSTMAASIITTTAASNAEMLGKVNLAITARLNGGAVQAYTINGRNIQYVTLTELWKMREQLEQVIAAEAGGTRNYARLERPS